MEASGHTAIVSKVIWSVFKLVRYWVRCFLHFSNFRTTKLPQSTSALRSVLIYMVGEECKESLVNFRNLTSRSTSAKTILASAMLGWRSQTRRPLWQVCSTSSFSSSSSSSSSSSIFWSSSWLSGADDVGPEGALLATLEFENSGAETVMIIRNWW